MNGIEKIIEHIRLQSEEQCRDITRKAFDECQRIKAEYAQAEQDEYWNRIDAGTKETEHRMERLKRLAEMESNKQILATQQEMIAEAFDLAVKKLAQLPKNQYSELLKRLDMKAGAGAGTIVERYKNELSPRVASALFK